MSQGSEIGMKEMSQETVVKIDSCAFKYGEGAFTLAVPHFEVKRGETVFLYGPSGSGKTTFLGLLTLVLKWQSGRMELFGKSTQEMNNAERDRLRGARIGYVFQMFNLVPYLTARENILLSCHLNESRRNHRSLEQLEQECRSLGSALEIEKWLDQPASRLSVGQQQRVAAARAFIGQPGLIIADEPTSALDSDAKNAFLELLLSEAQKANSALIMVSHDRDLANHFSRSVSIKEITR
jgi:putative ABC transport system ATP-binding protein